MRHGSDAADRLWWAPGPAPAPQTLVSCCGSSNPIHWPLAVLAAYVSAMPAPTKANRAAAGPAGGRSDQAFNWAPAALHLAALSRPEVSLPLAGPLLLPAATKSPWRRRPAVSCLRPPPPYPRTHSRPIPVLTHARSRPRAQDSLSHACAPCYLRKHSNCCCCCCATWRCKTRAADSTPHKRL